MSPPLLPNLPSQFFDDLENFDLESLDNQPIQVYWKDDKGKYRGANELAIKNIGLSNINELINFSDIEISSNAYSTIYRDHDLSVMSQNKPIYRVGPVLVLDQEQKIAKGFTIKSPLKSKTGKVIGVYGVTFLDQSALSQKSPNALQLSRQQITCIHYLVRGKTTKQIAKIMGLSPRTIEHYFDTIKVKLNCQTRGELFEKAFEMGLVT